MTKLTINSMTYEDTNTYPKARFLKKYTAMKASFKLLLPISLLAVTSLFGCSSNSDQPLLATANSTQTEQGDVDWGGGNMQASLISESELESTVEKVQRDLLRHWKNIILTKKLKDRNPNVDSFAEETVDIAMPIMKTKFVQKLEAAEGLEEQIAEAIEIVKGTEGHLEKIASMKLKIKKSCEDQEKVTDESADGDNIICINKTRFLKKVKQHDLYPRVLSMALHGSFHHMVKELPMDEAEEEGLAKAIETLGLYNREEINWELITSFLDNSQSLNSFIAELESDLQRSKNRFYDTEGVQDIYKRSFLEFDSLVKSLFYPISNQNIISAISEKEYGLLRQIYFFPSLMSLNMFPSGDFEIDSKEENPIKALLLLSEIPKEKVLSLGDDWFRWVPMYHKLKGENGQIYTTEFDLHTYFYHISQLRDAFTQLHKSVSSEENSFGPDKNPSIMDLTDLNLDDLIANGDVESGMKRVEYPGLTEGSAFQLLKDLNLGDTWNYYSNGIKMTNYSEAQESDYCAISGTQDAILKHTQAGAGSYEVSELSFYVNTAFFHSMAEPKNSFVIYCDQSTNSDLVENTSLEEINKHFKGILQSR
ncbi:MAG: hypothetical protein AB8E15_03665 [Bdellovibrionales bacterium]